MEQEEASLIESAIFMKIDVKNFIVLSSVDEGGWPVLSSPSHLVADSVRSVHSLYQMGLDR